MKTLPKGVFKAIFIALFSIWALHFIYPLYYTIAIVDIKQQQQFKIETATGKFIHHTLPDSIFIATYEKHEHEIKIDGMMYEVVSYFKAAEQVHCVLLLDAKETEIHKHFAKSIHSDKNKRQQKSHTNWQPLFYNVSESQEIHKMTASVIQLIPIVCAGVLLQGFKQKNIKPPEPTELLSNQYS